MTLVRLLSVACFLTACSPEEILIVTAVGASGHGEADSPPEAHARRSRILALDPRDPERNRRVLTKDFFSAESPALSYDGGWIVFAATRGEGEPWQVWEIRVDGSDLRQVTRGGGERSDPFYLPGGGIVFSGARENGGAGEGGLRSLFTCARDGSRVRQITFGRDRDTEPTVLSDGRILFARQRLSANGESQGPLEWMTVHPDGTGVARYQGEEALGRHVISSDGIPVSRPSTGNRAAGLTKANLEKDQTPIPYQERGSRAVGAMVARPRPIPKVLTSVVDETKKVGWLLCLNAYVSQRREISRLRPWDIKRVQAFEAVEAGSERLLGEAAVEKDGSFYLEVPSDTPLGLRLLDVRGEVLADFADGLWVRPNEHRGCVGCHEDPELSPENRRPLAVTKPPVSLIPLPHKPPPAVGKD
jgi:hypothetical protein